jgi:hypothetical protein
MSLALVLLASLAAVALALSAALVLGLRRRRTVRRASLAPLAAPRAPGVSHLADHVSELSDVGFHLGAARRGAEKRRLGVLLGLR